MMGFTLRLSPRLTQRQEQRLTLGQREAIKQVILNDRLSLVGAVHGGNYSPRAVCPKCKHEMTSLEIIQGFNTNPTDYTTGCTRCHHRFPPILKWANDWMSVEIPFYCPTQVLAQLHGLETESAEEIRRKHAAIYHSVVVHHGCLRKAFAKIGIQYAFESIPAWEKKVEDYLGRLPDTVIAQVVDQSVKTIRALRKKLNIVSFSRRTLIEVEE